MKHVITLGCLAGAAAMYAMGAELGAAILFAAGFLCELAFWKRALNSRKG